MSDVNHTYCSFCGKSAANVYRMVAGPGNVCICTECILTALGVIMQKAQQDEEASE
jgi:ATP-dependent Clp protease ATP-binding subunit ClpX